MSKTIKETPTSKLSAHSERPTGTHAAPEAHPVVEERRVMDEKALEAERLRQPAKKPEPEGPNEDMSDQPPPLTLGPGQVTGGVGISNGGASHQSGVSTVKK